VLWVIRDCLSGLVLLARALLSSACGDLAGLLREVAADLAALGVPVDGVVSDGQPSIRLAIARVWPDVPHQFSITCARRPCRFTRPTGTPRKS
jgi:hypothetical protein